MNDDIERLYIDKKLEDKIRQYCNLNNIEDIGSFVNACARQGFNIVLYGVSPMDNANREKGEQSIGIEENISDKKETPIKATLKRRIKPIKKNSND